MAPGRGVAAVRQVLLRYGQPVKPNCEVGAPSARADRARKESSNAIAVILLIWFICTSVYMAICYDIAIKL